MLHTSDLRKQAQCRLGELSGNPKKLVLIHTAIALGSSLLLTVLTYLSSLMIADTGGLDGLGTRSVLTTAQSVLEILILIGLPIWQRGIYYAALQWINGEKPGFASLLQGFRRFGAVLRFLFLQVGSLIILGIAVFNLSSVIFTLTPFAEPFLELYKPFMAPDITPEQIQDLMTAEFIASAMDKMIPLLIIFCILYLIVLIPLFYRIRFADFAFMDGLPGGRSLLKSFSITKKTFWQVLKLDLSFWWFYLLQLLSVAICYADTILAALGVSLPVSPAVAAFGFYILGIACQGLLLWQFEAKRITVYALAYRTLDGSPESIEGDVEA